MNTGRFHTHSGHQSGNVLFLILIAVALFAALSYAVTQSSRSGGDGVTKDKARLYASQFLQYGNAVEQAVSRIRLIARAPEYGIDMTSSVTWSSTANTTCATDACKVFHPDGGGVSPFLIDERAFDKTLPIAGGANYRTSIFRTSQVQEVGSSLSELILIIAGLNKETCAAINNMMKINDGGNPPTELYSPGYGDYKGTLTAFPESSGSAVFGDEAAIFKGKRTFCAYHNTTSGYQFYHVLMER